MKPLSLLPCLLVLSTLAQAATIKRGHHKGSKNSVKFGTKHRKPKSHALPTADDPVVNVAVQPGTGSGAVNAANGGPNDIALGDARDLIYFSNVTIGGNSYLVQLDTGSSDLWVHSPNGQIPNSLRSDLSGQLGYGIGHANGPIVTAPVDFAGFHVDKQALINANDAENPVLDMGAVGVLGLGFTQLSTIDSDVNGTGGAWGRSLLYNIFAGEPTLPNIITFLFNRDNDPQAPAEGSFTVSEVDPDYAAVSSQPQISTWPTNSPTRWTVLMDSFLTQGKPYTAKSTVSGVPSGKTAILLDSGTSFSYAPESVVKALYANVTGAKWNEVTARFDVPCDSEADFSFIIGGHQYDLHPLDMVDHDPDNPSQCVGGWIAQSFSDEFDFLIGANTLRSFYALYDFSAVTSAGSPIQPFVQLLQVRSQSDMVIDFHAVRGGQPAGIVAVNPTGSGGPTTSADGGVTPGTTTTTTTDSVSDSIQKILNFLPIILGVLGLNAVLLVVVVLGGIFFLCCRRKGKGGRSGRKSPTANSPGAGGFGLSPIGAQQNGGDYRPVSTVSDIERDGDHEERERRDSHSTVAKSILIPGSPTEPNITLTGVPELRSDAPPSAPSPVQLSITGPGSRLSMATPPPGAPMPGQRLSVATPPPGAPMPGQRLSIATPPPAAPMPGQRVSMATPPPGMRHSMINTNAPPGIRNSMLSTPPPGARHSMINTRDYSPTSPPQWSPQGQNGPAPIVPPRRAPPPAPLQRPHSVAVSVAAGVPVPASPVGSYASGVDGMEDALLTPPNAPFSQGQQRHSVVSLRGVPGASAGLSPDMGAPQYDSRTS